MMLQELRNKMIGAGGSAGGSPFNGTRATYVALSSVSILALAVVTSIWHSDVSGSIAVLGIMSIYMSSTELLMLFTVLAPASIVADVVRLVASRDVRAHGWLVFFTLLEMGAKGVGAVFGWSLHRSIGTGDGPSGGGGGAYHAINAGGGHGGGGAVGGGYAPMGGAGGGGLTMSGGPGLGAPEDPFAAYAPPRSEHHNAPPVSSTYQPFPNA